MTAQEQMDKSEYIKVPYPLLLVDIGAGVLYGVLTWLTHDTEMPLRTTYKELADLLARHRDWVKRRMDILEALGAVEVQHHTGQGITITLRKIQRLRILQSLSKIQRLRKLQSLRKIQQLEEEIHSTSEEDTLRKIQRLGKIQSLRKIQSLGKIQQPTTDKASPEADLDGTQEIIINNNNNNSLSKEREEGDYKGEEGEKKATKKKKIPSADIDAVFTAYNQTLGDVLPRVMKITPARRDAVRRILHRWSKDEVIELFHKVREMPFLLGQNQRGWRASFDWLMKERNLIKVLEDPYGWYKTPTGIDKRPRKRYNEIDETDLLLKGAETRKEATDDEDN